MPQVPLQGVSLLCVVLLTVVLVPLLVVHVVPVSLVPLIVSVPPTLGRLLAHYGQWAYRCFAPVGASFASKASCTTTSGNVTTSSSNVTTSDSITNTVSSITNTASDSTITVISDINSARWFITKNNNIIATNKIMFLGFHAKTRFLKITEISKQALKITEIWIKSRKLLLFAANIAVFHCFYGYFG